MNILVKSLIGILALAIAFPLGNFLAKITKEELKNGKRWFKLIIILSSIGLVIGIIVKKIEIVFWFLFIVIIAKKCLIR